MGVSVHIGKNSKDKERQIRAHAREETSITQEELDAARLRYNDLPRWHPHVRRYGEWCMAHGGAGLGAADWERYVRETGDLP